MTEGQFRINPVCQPRLPACLTRLQGPMSRTQFDLTFCQFCSIQSGFIYIRHTAAGVTNGLHNSCSGSRRAKAANAASIAVHVIIKPARQRAGQQLSDKHNHHLKAELCHWISHWFPLTYRCVHTVAQRSNKAVCHAIKSIAAHRFSAPAERRITDCAFFLLSHTAV